MPSSMPTFVPSPSPTAGLNLTTNSPGSTGTQNRPRHPTPHWLTFGRPLVFGGLFFVMCLRGCDSLADRYANRLVASSQVAEPQFNDDWSARRGKLEVERDELNAKSDRTIDDDVRLENIQKQLETLNEQMRKERAEKQLEWNELRNAARDAQASTRMWAFWRQLLFLPAALVFVAGLILVGSAADGAERWLCLTMLAIVVYSLFVGGAAWTG